MLKDDLSIPDRDLEIYPGLPGVLEMLDSGLESGEILDVLSLDYNQPILVDTDAEACEVNDELTLENVGMKVIYPAHTYTVEVVTSEGDTISIGSVLKH